MLDNPEELRSYDPQEMLSVLGCFDQQLEEALKIGEKAEVPAGGSVIQNILVSGVGGSAIGGDFLRAYLGRDLKVPLLVNRNYWIPGFVDSTTLVLICSYSGNTEEAISAFDEAHRAKANIICVTSNGDLKRRAQEHGYPYLRIPGGYPPRAALGYSTIPVLVILGRLGLVADHSQDVSRSLAWVRHRVQVYGPDCPTRENPAKELALRMYQHIPILYGSQDRLEMVAVRWRGQISENAKQLAYSSTLPEMNHNEIVGWKHPAVPLRKIVAIFLRDHEDHPRVQVRAELTRDLVAARSGSAFEYWTDGQSWLERLWTLILLGDYASVYLAFLNQENPTPVEVIEALKNRLKEFP